MLNGLNDLPTDQGFPAGSKMFVYQEVIDQNDGAIKVDEYYDTGTLALFIRHQKSPFDVERPRLRHRVPLLLEDRVGHPELRPAEQLDRLRLGHVPVGQGVHLRRQSRQPAWTRRRRYSNRSNTIITTLIARDRQHSHPQDPSRVQTSRSVHSGARLRLHSHNEQLLLRQFGRWAT